MYGHWENTDAGEIESIFRTDLASGLGEKEARARLARTGPNLVEGKDSRVSMPSMMRKQFGSPLVLGIVAAAAWSARSGLSEALGVFVLVFMAAGIGLIRETRVNRLRGSGVAGIVSQALVIRGSAAAFVNSSSLVPGDLVVLGSGDRVPADIAIISADGLEVRGGTGGKIRGIAEETQPGKTGCMAYMGSYVSRGSGRGVVVATGAATEAGKQAAMATQVKRDDKTADKYAVLSRWLTIVFALSAMYMAFLALNHEADLPFMVLTGLCFAYAASPSGLPVMKALAMEEARRRMAGKGVVAKSAGILESLGRADVVCVSGIRSFTLNEMAVMIVTGRSRVEISGEGNNPRGRFKTVEGGDEKTLEMMMKTAAMCSKAVLKKDGKVISGFFRGPHIRGSAGDWEIEGDLTDGALLVMAARAGIWKEALLRQEEMVMEVPPAMERGFTTVVCRDKGQSCNVYAAGDFQALLERCTHQFEYGLAVPLKESDHNFWKGVCSDVSSRKLKVAGLAWKRASTGELAGGIAESGFTFIGACGIANPLRPGLQASVFACRRMGIRPVMITDESLETAVAVAQDAGLLADGGRMVTAAELDGLPGEELGRVLEKVSVIAGISEEHKLNVLRALQRSGHRVAFAGDGTGDMRVLLEADAGICTGVPLTSAAWESAPLCLWRGGFPAVSDIMVECRRLVGGVSELYRCVLACRAGDLMVMVIVVLASLPMPLLPVQVLWANLLREMVLWAAGNRPVLESQVTVRSGNGFCSKTWTLAARGALMASACVLSFWIYLSATGDLPAARTVALSALVFVNLAVILDRYRANGNTQKGSVWYFKLWGILLAAGILQVAATEIHLLNRVLGTDLPGVAGWVLAVVLSGIPFLAGSVYQKFREKISRIILYIRV